MVETIGKAFPLSMVQICTEHLIRNNLDYAGGKDRKADAAALRGRHSPQAVEQALQAFSPMGPLGDQGTKRSLRLGSGPGRTSRRSSSSRRTSVIYTTNAIESLNMQLRQIIKTRAHFPTDEAAIKPLRLALRNNVPANSIRATFGRKAAMNQFSILFGARPTAARE